jgi:tape measure domain-containing protein
MSDEIERLLVRVEANASQFEAQMRKLNKSLYASQAENRKTLNAIQKDTEAASRRMFTPIGDGLRREVASLAGVFAGLFTTQQVARYADQYTSLQNRLKAAGLEGENLKRVEDALYETANRNGLQVQATAELYQRASLSRQRLGASEQQLLALVSGTAAALKVQGTSAEAASGPLLQLGQVLGGAKVQAEEYNSLIDGLPVLLQAAAKGSDRFGGDVAKLTEAVKSGSVSSQEFFQALLKGFPEIQKQAEGSATTISSALQTLDNEFGRYIGRADESLSASQRVAQGIQGLAENLDQIIPVVGVLAALIGGGYVASLTMAASQMAIAGLNAARLTAFNIAMTASMTGATRAQVALNLAMAANPVGLVVTVVAALAAGLYVLATRYNTTAIAARELDKVVGAADTALEDYRKAVDAAKNASAAERVELDKKAQALRNVTLARINDAKVAAQKQIDEAVAARQRADRSIGDSADARSRAFANPNNANAALAGGASSQARANISLAVRARQEADTAIRAYERLKGAMENIDNPRSGGGAPPAPSPDAGSSRGSSDANRTSDLRERLSLEEDLARVRATGDEAAIKREEERQRIIEATERYREAGYEDAAQRAINLIAAENQAEDVAEQRERTQTRIREGIEREAELKRQAADWTERQHSAELEIARLRGDDAAIRRLEREAALRQRIAEYVERYGVAGVGLAVAEQLKFDQAASEGDMNYAAENAARTFVDVIAADDPWEAAGNAFKRAAFDNLESLFSNVFKSLMSNNKDGGGLLGSIASGLQSWFGGKGSFDSGGYTGPGGKHDVAGLVHRGEVVFSKADIARHGGVGAVEAMRKGLPGYADGGVVTARLNSSILTNGQMRGLQTGSVRTSGGVLAVTVDVSGANGDAAVAAIAEAAARRGAEAAVAQSRADQAQANAAKRYRLK